MVFPSCPFSGHVASSASPRLLLILLICGISLLSLANGSIIVLIFAKIQHLVPLIYFIINFLFH